MKNRIIAIDFDGTCVKHKFPKVGEDIGAAPVLKSLVKSGHSLILWTMRSNKSDVETGYNPELTNESGEYLDDAVNWFKNKNIPLLGIQTNPTQKNWTTSPKAYAHLYIDDAALGIPLIHPKNERPYVNWGAVDAWLYHSKWLTDEDSYNRFKARAWKCDNCGSTEVMETSWIDINKDTIADNYDNKFWCENCQTHPKRVSR